MGRTSLSKGIGHIVDSIKHFSQQKLLILTKGSPLPFPTTNRVGYELIWLGAATGYVNGLTSPFNLYSCTKCFTKPYSILPSGHRTAKDGFHLSVEPNGTVKELSILRVVLHKGNKVGSLT
jgi:hypothetical protein